MLTRYACFLRAVNVAGARRLKMAPLRTLAEELGYLQVESYLQSGNLVISTKESAARVRKRLSTAIAQAFGYGDVCVFAWTADELEGLIEDNPFPGKGADPKHLHVTILEKDPGEEAISALDPKAFGPDAFAPGAEALYVHCPNGYGRTKLNNALFERKLKMKATTRNWKTTLALRELAST